MAALGRRLVCVAWVGGLVALPAVRPADPTKPAVRVAGHDEARFEPGVTVHTWELRGNGCSELVARVLVVADGKSRTPHTLTAKWDQPPADMKCRLALCLQNGDAFGAKDKTLPSLALHFPVAGPKFKVSTRSNAFIESPHAVRQREVVSDVAIPPAEDGLVFSEFLGPADAKPPAGRGIDALVEATKGGRAAVALMVRWKP